jgi:hypothetical protein
LPGELIEADMRLLEVGDVRCACGLVYRYALTAAGPALWPQTPAGGFSPTPLDGDACSRCDRPLAALAIRASGTPREQPASRL